MISQKKKQTTCLKFTAYLSVILLLFPSVFGATYSKNYRYYNTREDYPTRSPHTRTRSQYTQKQIDDAWIIVPWSHGGHYYHNTITREDKDTKQSSL